MNLLVRSAGAKGETSETTNGRVTWDKKNLIVGCISSSFMEVWMNPKDLSDIEKGENEQYLKLDNSAGGHFSGIAKLLIRMLTFVVQESGLPARLRE